MRNYCVLLDALAYIEAHLEMPVAPEDVAEACFCSLSSLQKLFRYAVHDSVMAYIAKRRLNQAAKDLIKGDQRVIDIALKYQYQSPEVFVRAFQKLWGTTPSAFKRERKFAGIFPRIHGSYETTDRRGEFFMRKQVDISELYDVLRDMADVYVLCFDISGLMPINELGREAGDLAILTCYQRLDEAATPEMLLLRIGGDEFALVTGYKEAADAERLARAVLARNGETVNWKGHEIPISMYVGGLRMSGDRLRYNELFQDLHDAIRRSKMGETQGITLE